MYGKYHLARGKNPALSCLIGFVSMNHVKEQNIVPQYYSTSNSSLGRHVVYSSIVRVERSLS